MAAVRLCSGHLLVLVGGGGADSRGQWRRSRSPHRRCRRRGPTPPAIARCRATRLLPRERGETVGGEDKDKEVRELEGGYEDEIFEVLRGWRTRRQRDACGDIVILKMCWLSLLEVLKGA
uniref:DUF834 domain-containing protein n=1 Tax=Oryza glaberrima TaxID=4538 RepID=I1R0Z6_ORYGL